MELIINEELRSLIPPLSEQEYSMLELDLAMDGCRDAIIAWDNTIIDGHNRYEICKKHNIKFEVLQKSFDNIEDVKDWMDANQLGRRNLTDDQRKILIGRRYNREKKLQAGRSDRSFGAAEFATPKTDERLASENKVSPRSVRNYAKQASDFEILQQENPLMAQSIFKGEKTFKEIEREKKSIERGRRAEEGKYINVSVDFRLGDFEKVLDDIPDNSVDCIITDPPYPHEFIECWSKLSLFAAKKLKENGFCIAYSGQYNLPEVIDRMRENLNYYWTFAVYHEGQTQIVNAVNLICRWKPILIFQNGKKKLDNTFQDYFISEQREKDGHDWQQSKSGVSYLIEMFTNPGDLIVEPFAGSGTTIIACKNMNRNVIGAEIDENTYNIAKFNIYDQTEK